MSFRRNNPEHGSGDPGKQPKKGKIGVNFIVLTNSKGRKDKVRIGRGDPPVGTSDRVSAESLDAILEIIHNPSGLKPRHRR
ncbi:MAG: hypothetical protein ACD_38C00156G0008 [uncultured bacterium]|uniref:Uncharacterized protein n=1 Tax=Candidatus Daviesbacteria bacterium GW2011_GWC2_40_12 TaxID=1618431 RepID=A0A0G0QY82_9BACT|nr:MAG: hypothetical protein ACD_38C00156G0008 [uncultured bacterium]KKQ82958.1 MAG: hypothetical protein UT04_C0042G0002 [Candidatus Daviesbacteria bacterium GW2011_GWF2_38_7]KKR16797.1 MAG: hypothetical protein UT45_C0004G0128 [Candidatus Daviesbacteria bacterium GW2011_GWA2_39_33]KKR24639.1 MAG: hypothetical protein UT54_C0015G0016 [Candidatus Daviesbacteria bacterium GW2011_GWB1_39_5]KKR42421.1 MAG: hypothetical protein UT77_C0002G0074 [Candidatus Daviesbacteria bacterium GW2011_GWC2_40_12]